MSFLIHQCWFHYQDIYYPYPVQEVRKVIDIFTNVSFIPIELGNLKLFGLKIIARNSNRNEIAFSWDQSGDYIILNVDLNAFPPAPDPYSNCRHIKIELEYILVPKKKDIKGIPTFFSYLSSIVNPPVESSKIVEDDDKVSHTITRYIRKDGENGCLFDELIDTYIRPKWTAYMDYDEVIMPEFDLIFPKGWEIGHQGNDFTYFSEWLDQYFEEQEDSEEDKEEMPAIQWIDGKLRYSYLLRISNDYYNPVSTNHRLRFKYLTRLSSPFVLLSSLIPLIMLIFSIAILFTIPGIGLFPINFTESAPFLTLLLLVVTYAFTYLSYLKDGYALPYQSRTAIIIAVAFVILIIRIFTIQTAGCLQLTIFC